MTKPIAYTILSLLIGLGVAAFTRSPPDVAGPGGFFDGVWHGATVWLGSLRWISSGEIRLYEGSGGFWYRFGLLSTLLIYIDLLSEVLGSAARRLILGESTQSDQLSSVLMLAVYLTCLLLGGLLAGIRVPPVAEPSLLFTIGLIFNLLLSGLLVPALWYVMKR